VNPKPVPSGPIEIRDLKSGTLKTRFASAGTVLALALSDQVVAVVVRSGRSALLEDYSLRGRRLGSVHVPLTSAPALAASGNNIVYATGRTIRLLDASSGRTSAIATAGAAPFDISIQGARVIWAENLHSVGRIRMVSLSHSGSN
jgi:hypothetical protein